MEGGHSLLERPFKSNNTILDSTGNSSTCDTVATLLCGLIIVVCLCWFFDRVAKVSELRKGGGQGKGVLVDMKEKERCSSQAFYYNQLVSHAMMETHTLSGRRHQIKQQATASEGGDETSFDYD